MLLEINIVEAASVIAADKVDNQLGPSALNIIKPEEHGYYNEVGQELFNQMYDEAWEMLENCAPKTKGK
mgnify:CR=1 FL=1